MGRAGRSRSAPGPVLGAMKYLDGVPNVVGMGLLDLQVCVPKSWTDGQVLLFAENAAGRPGRIRRDGDPDLRGDPERNGCEELPGHVHIMVDL